MSRQALFKQSYLVAFIALLLTSCSYEYTLSITVLDSAGNPAGANVRVIVAKSAIDQSGIPTLTSKTVGSTGELEVALCCSPNPEVWVYVFVDANASSYWDSGELLQSAQNPLRLDDDMKLDIQFE